MSGRRFNATLPALAALAACVGCVTPDHMARLQKDMADVRAAVDEVKRDQAAAKQALDEVRAKQAAPVEQQVSREEVADLDARLDQLTRDRDVAEARARDLGQQLERIERELRETRDAARRPSPQGTPPAPQGSDSTAAILGTPPRLSPTDLYNTAYTDFSKGNYALAISGFEEFYQKYADNPLADNALYWVGECHFSQGNFAEAIRSFDRMLEAYPQSDKAAAADLKKGLAFLERNQIREAIVQLQHVRSTYPGSDEAKIARDKLTSLGAPT